MNSARLFRAASARPPLRRLAATAKRVLGRHLDEDEREPVGVARDQLDEPPGFQLRFLFDRHAPLDELFADSAHVAHLEDEAGGVRRRRMSGARDFEQAAAEEKDDAAARSLAPLAVDGEAEHAFVEAERALELSRMEQDAARQDLH
jgi:hypothetical protein